MTCGSPSADSDGGDARAREAENDLFLTLAHALRAFDEHGADRWRVGSVRFHAMALGDDLVFAARAALLRRVEARTEARRRLVEAGLVAARREEIATRLGGGILVVA